MEKPNDTEKLDMLYMFAKKALEEKNKGRSLVSVDDKLLEWVDEQVDSRKYVSRSHAIGCALVEFKERRKSKGDLEVSEEVSGCGLLGHAAWTNKSLDWNDIDETNRRYAIEYLLASSKLGLHMALKRRFGDNLQAKIDCLKKLLEECSKTLPSFQKVVYTKFLNELSEKERKRKHR